MPMPSMVTYNELDGTEVAGVLRNRFDQFLGGVPYFQKHLTLPRVKISFQVKLEIWADQPQPEAVRIGDSFEVIVEHDDEPIDVFEAESSDSSAPIPGGHPPDQIREMHGLPMTQPVRGDVAIADRALPLEGREVEGTPGLKISRTGSGMIDGMPTSANATVIKMDPGPAGLRSGQMNRTPMHYGGSNRS